MTMTLGFGIINILSIIHKNIWDVTLNFIVHWKPVFEVWPMWLSCRDAVASNYQIVQMSIFIDLKFNYIRTFRIYSFYSSENFQMTLDNFDNWRERMKEPTDDDLTDDDDQSLSLASLNQKLMVKYPCFMYYFPAEEIVYLSCTLTCSKKLIKYLRSLIFIWMLLILFKYSFVLLDVHHVALCIWGKLFIYPAHWNVARN